MRIGLQEPDWQHIGAVLGRADDEAQGAFFKAFIKECQSWGTQLQVENQMAFINMKLSEEEREVLSMITYIEEKK